MKKLIFMTLIFFFINLISYGYAKCTLMPTDDERSIAYVCVQGSLADLDPIPDGTEWIEFSVSRIHEIPAGAFSRFSLRRLSFYNCDIRQIDSQAFKGLIHLEWLIFYNSRIPVAKASWFRGLYSLTRLVLDKNELVHIEPGIFPLVPHLETLSLEDNNLNCLPTNALTSLKRLKNMDIRNNPWLCSCQAELIRWMDNRKVEYGKKDMMKTFGWECMEEYEPAPNDLTKPLNLELSTSTNSSGGYISTGRSFSALNEVPDGTRWVKFSGAHIPIIPEYAFLRFGNSLKSLEFISCGVQEIHPEAFAGLPKLERLVLFNNSIVTVRADWFRNLHSLKHLILDRNRIENVESSVFSLLSNLESLSLEQNNIQCLSINEFSALKNLKTISVANNPWMCSCQAGLKRWMNENHVAYEKNGAGQCQEVSGHESSMFQGQQSGVDNRDTSLVDHITTSSGMASYNQTQTLADFSTQYTTYDHREESNSITAGPSGFNTPVPAMNISRNHNSQILDPFQNIATNCVLVRVNNPNIQFPHACFGGTLADLNQIPNRVDRLEFLDTEIRLIHNNAFARFGDSLKILEFYNCGIQGIEPQAFSGLSNLESLVLHKNNINTVRSEWFQSLRSLKHLSLVGNSIHRIEKGFYYLLPNLVTFDVADNQLNCLGIDGLAQLKNLNTLSVRNNPLGCLCRMKLTQWLDENNVEYEKDFFQERVGWECFKSNHGFDTSIAPNANIIDAKGNMAKGSTTIVRTDRYFENYEAATGTCNLAQPTNNTSITPYSCIGEDISVLNQVPADAKWIELSDTRIPKLPPNAFARFVNLTRLAFYNCSLREIDPLAFANLQNLEWLVFYNNTIPTVRAAWFQDLHKLHVLGLDRNSVNTVEPDTFEKLSQLESFSLKNNSITCLYTRSLSSLKNLRNMEIGNNPWKWRCREELTKFLTAHNVTYSYTQSESYQGKRVIWDLQRQDRPQSMKCGECSVAVSHRAGSTVKFLCGSVLVLLYTSVY